VEKTGVPEKTIELSQVQSPKEHVDQVSANILNIAGRISNYTLENRKCKYTCYFANITGKMEYGYCPKFKRGELLRKMVYGVYRPFQQYFSYIVTVSFIGGENWSTGENHRTVASH
jgi:hypothetical protein